MGSDGAIFIGSEMLLLGPLFQRLALPALLEQETLWLQDLCVLLIIEIPWKIHFKFGVAAGTATALKGNLCEFQDVKKMLCEIRVEDVCIS